MKGNAVDSTAILSQSNPVYSFIEVGLAGLSPEASMSARLIGAVGAYAGLGSFYSKGRDISNALFKMPEKKSEPLQGLHDLVFTGGFTLLVSPPIYAASQYLTGDDFDWAKIAIGSGLSTLFALANGAPKGYAVDVVRDLAGVRECNRPTYPQIVKRQGSRMKKAILACAVLASLALMGTVYSLAPDIPAKRGIEATVPSLEKITLESSILR